MSDILGVLRTDAVRGMRALIEFVSQFRKLFSGKAGLHVLTPHIHVG